MPKSRRRVRRYLGTMFPRVMSSVLVHSELSAGPTYNRSDTEICMPAHVLYDKRRSKTNNMRSFRRYLALLRGLHAEKYNVTYASFEHNSPRCLVCASSKGRMHNTFHKKCGSFFKLDSTPWHNAQLMLQGLVVEVDCDFNAQKLWMCETCHDQWVSDSNSVGSVDNMQACKVLRRFWMRHKFPLLRSVMRA